MSTMMINFRDIFGTMAIFSFMKDSGATICPTGALRCEMQTDYYGNDIGDKEIVATFQQCFDICVGIPQCVAALFRTNGDCYQKHSFGVKTLDIEAVIAIRANNTAQEVTPSCESCGINSKCRDMQALKSFSIAGNPVCINQDDELYFGDYNNDGICDSACFSRSTLYLQWGVGRSSMDHMQPSVALVGVNQGNLGVFCDSVSTLYTRDVNGDGYDDLVCNHLDHFQVLFSDTNGLKLTSETVTYEKNKNCPALSSSCLMNIGCTSVQSLCNCTTDLLETPPHGTYEPQTGNGLLLICNAGYIRRGQMDGIIFCDGLSNLYQRTSFCQKQDYKHNVHVKNQKAANMIGFSYFESSNTPSMQECLLECNSNLRCQWLSYNLNKSMCLKFEWQMTNKQLVDDYDSVVAWFPHE